MAEKSVDKSVVGEVGNEEEQRGKEEEKKSGGAQKRTIHYFTQVQFFLVCVLKYTFEEERVNSKNVGMFSMENKKLGLNLS